MLRDDGGSSWLQFWQSLVGRELQLGFGFSFRLFCFMHGILLCRLASFALHVVFCILHLGEQLFMTLLRELPVLYEVGEDALKFKPFNECRRLPVCLLLSVLVHQVDPSTMHLTRTRGRDRLCPLRKQLWPQIIPVMDLIAFISGPQPFKQPLLFRFPLVVVSEMFPVPQLSEMAPELQLQKSNQNLQHT